MDLEKSLGDIDCKQRIGVLRKCKSKLIIVKFIKCMDKRRVFTNKKRLKGKNMSIMETLTKIIMSTLNEARNTFKYSRFWTADRKAIYKDKGDAKAKVYLFIDQAVLVLRKSRNIFLF